MKKFLSLLLAVLLLLSSAIGASAEDVDLSDEGKTVFTIGDWVYSAIDGGSHLEIQEYVGSGTELIVPRIVNDMMVVAIVNNCFSENTSVTSVSTSSPLWTVGDYAFLNCTSLQNFECNFALKEIGVGAFSGTSALKTINLEDSVITVVRPHAFMNSGIEQVKLPDTCTEIMHDAFSQCPLLNKIVIPQSVETIHEDAFKNSEQVVIYCYPDSAAHQFAVAQEIPYVLLTDYYLGDADSDGDVSIIDATLIQRLLADVQTPALNLLAADVDGEGLDVIDATYIQRYLALITTPYPNGELITGAIA